jgi:hypothetical protein
VAEPPSILPSLAKIDRADENLRNLNDLFSSLIARRPYTVVNEPDPNPKTRGFRITDVEAVGLPLRVLVGEIAHHLRSAFDLLVYQLMLKAGVTDYQRLSRCAFPVIVDLDLRLPDGRKEYETTMRRKVEGISPLARARIEKLQPCHGTRMDSFLSQIDFLDNTDKHRLLLALVGSVSISGFNFRDITGAISVMPHKTYIPLQKDAVIKLELPDPSMNVDLKLPLDITFGESGVFYCRPVVPKLQELSDFARNTIQSFSVDF